MAAVHHRLLLLVTLTGMVVACDDDAVAPDISEEPTAASYAAFSAGLDYTCAIETDGSLACWGRIIGVDAEEAALRPAPVAQGSGFAAVASGTTHTCALAIGGAARCWGANDRLQLGSGDTLSSTAPRAVGGPVHAFQVLSSGAYHTCGVSLDDRAYCWGWNRYGQLGNNSTIGQGLPAQVHGDFEAQDIAAGGTHTCAVTRDGRAFCWGRGGRGQLGSGSTDDQLGAVQVTGTQTYAAITAGDAHSCALAADGTAWCWGAGTAGQLGNGETEDAATPVQVMGGRTYASITAGSEHTCAVEQNGAAWCWGHNAHGRLGTGGLPAILPAPAAVAGELRFRALSAGRLHTCGVTTDDVGYCWGFGGFGQLGSGSVISRAEPTPVAPATATGP